MSLNVLHVAVQIDFQIKQEQYLKMSKMYLNSQNLVSCQNHRLSN